MLTEEEAPRVIEKAITLQQCSLEDELVLKNKKKVQKAGVICKCPLMLMS